MSAMTYSSSFVIPRKKTTDTEEVKRVKEIPLDSREFLDNIAPIFKQSFYNQQLKDSVRFGKCLLINNKELSSKLDARRKALKARGYQEAQLNFSYAFLHVTKDEIEQICDEGLQIGNSIDGSLGDASQGVYLCKHADLTTPAPPASGCDEAIVVFRILKGRSKQVGLHSNNLDPDYTFDSHIAKPTATTGTAKVSRIDLYLQNRVYLYEYGEGSTEVVEVPTSVCPIAVIHCQFPDDLRWFANHNAWRGNLSVGSTSFAASMSSHYTTLKIHDLGQTLELGALVPWEQCLQYQPLSELIWSDQTAAIAKRREVVLIKGLNAGLRASYWTISSSDLDYRPFYDNMKCSRVAGITSLPGGTNLIVMPTGELSALLGLPNWSERTLHCVVVSYRSVTLGINFSANDVFDKREFMFRQPALSEQVDGVNEGVVDIFNQSFVQSQQMEQQAVVAQLDDAGLLHNPVAAMKDPRVRMRWTKIGNGLGDIASALVSQSGGGDGGSVSTHYSDRAAFGAAVDTLTERSFEGSSAQSDNDALVVDDGAGGSGDDDPLGATFSPSDHGEDEAASENACTPLFSENSSLCLQLDEALSEVSTVAQAVDVRPPKKRAKVDQALPTTNGKSLGEKMGVEGIRKKLNELKAITQSPSIDSTGNQSIDDMDMDTPESPPPQATDSANDSKPLIIAFDNGDADDTLDADQISSSNSATCSSAVASSSHLPSRIEATVVPSAFPSPTPVLKTDRSPPPVPVGAQEDTDLRNLKTEIKEDDDRTTSWRAASQHGSNAPPAAPSGPPGGSWRGVGQPMGSRWDQPLPSNTWRRPSAAPLLPAPPAMFPVRPQRGVPLLPLPTVQPLAEVVQLPTTAPPPWPTLQQPAPLSDVHPPRPSRDSPEQKMSRHGVIVPDELVFTRASCSPEVLETMLKRFQHGLNTKTSFWSVKLHSQVVLQLASAKKKLEKDSPAYTRASKVLALLHRFRQCGVIELLPYHPCDDRSRNAEEYHPCVAELCKRVGDYSTTIFLTNLDRNSRTGKLYESSGISVMSLDVLLNTYDIK